MQPEMRRKLVREILDEDKNIQQRVSQIQRKNIPQEDAKFLRKQLNTDDVQKLNIYAASIRKVLEHKATISKFLLSHSINENTLNKYIIDISSVEELMAMYNYIVNIYRSLGLSQKSRQAMKSIFMSFSFYIDTIIKNMKMALPLLSENPNIQSYKNAISFYEIIDGQLKKGVPFEITLDEF
jgi:hypothetical protein